MKYAAKDVINSSEVYVISMVDFEYNDEYYYVEGSTPINYATTFAQAKNFCINKNNALCAENDWRTGPNVAYDHTHSNRWDWYFEYVLQQEPLYSYEPYDVWDYIDFPWMQMTSWVLSNNLDLYDYLPGIYIFSKVMHINEI